ncbi:MAG: discoidin domain-containing protein, partial [Planctomycetota bacterium]
MCKKLLYLISFVLVLALTGTNVAFGQVVWEGRIEDGMDAVEQQASGNIDSGSPDLEFMYDGGIQTIGLRFVKVFVPPGATITNAYVEFTRDSSDPATPVHIIIQGDLTPNAPAFTSTPFDVSNRPKTTAVAKWSPEPWPVGGQQHQTSDISVVIEEIVNQPGWASGNALVLIFDLDPDNPSQGIRTADTGGMSTAPLLHIEYTLGKATGPSPADGAIDVPRDVVLSWKPGKFAAPTNGHKFYFSESFNDVNDGIGDITQSASSYTPPQRLDFSTTYYWRVDEVNNVNPKSPWTGQVWSFTTELIAYPIAVGNITTRASSTSQAEMGPEKTIDGSGLDENDLHSSEGTDMWLSGAEPLGAWIEYQFDKAYKLHQMWVWNSNQTVEPLIGFGLRDVTVEYSSNGTDYTTLGTTVEFARASGAGDYAHDTTIDFGGESAKYVKLTATSNWGGFMPQYGLSEVRFFYIPLRAREPSPDSGATDVDVDVTLGFRAGREAAQHDVCFSADEQAVIDGNAPVTVVTEASYGPLSLDLSMTYYWKINEVNEAETLTTLEGDLWSFTTTDHLIVDNFESYNDLDTAESESKRIFNVWIDGY